MRADEVFRLSLLDLMRLPLRAMGVGRGRHPGRRDVLGGLVDVRLLAWAGPPLMAAVLLQLLLHLLDHDEFRATRDQRLAALPGSARADPAARRAPVAGGALRLGPGLGPGPEPAARR